MKKLTIILIVVACIGVGLDWSPLIVGGLFSVGIIGAAIELAKQEKKLKDEIKSENENRSAK